MTDRQLALYLQGIHDTLGKIILDVNNKLVESKGVHICADGDHCLDLNPFVEVCTALDEAISVLKGEPPLMHVSADDMDIRSDGMTDILRNIMGRLPNQSSN